MSTSLGKTEGLALKQRLVRRGCGRVAREGPVARLCILRADSNAAGFPDVLVDLVAELCTQEDYYIRPAREGIDVPAGSFRKPDRVIDGVDEPDTLTIDGKLADGMLATKGLARA